MGSEEKKENGWNRESAETLKQWIEESDNIVFFGGAGVSTESGIPDFRSVDGLYHQQYKYPPEKAKGAVDVVIKQAELMSSNIRPEENVYTFQPETGYSMAAEEYVPYGGNGTDKNK